MTHFIDAPDKCPRCGELLVFPRGDEPYCEDCGYPDEDFNDTPVPLTKKEELAGWKEEIG